MRAVGLWLTLVLATVVPAGASAQGRAGEGGRMARPGDGDAARAGDGSARKGDGEVEVEDEDEYEEEDVGIVRPTVVAIELHLPPGADATGISDKVVVTRGAPLSITQVRRSVELLYATLRFSDVVVRQAEAEGGVRLIFELTPRRKLAVVDVEGERALTEAEVIASSRLLEAEDLYPELLDEARERVRALYGRRGFREARVSLEVHEDERGPVAFVGVEEGAPTRVSGISVSGNPGLPVARVVETLGLSPGAVLDMEQLAAGIEALRALYRQERFFRARVGEPVVVEDGQGRATVAVPAAAGPRYDFAFHGNRSFPEKLLLSMLGWDGTEALDDAATDRMAQRVSSFYRYRGFHDVRVTPREVRTPSQSRARLVFDVEEGRQLWVREVRFEGNEAISTDTLRAMLAEQVLEREPQPKGEVPPRIDPMETQGRAPGGRRASAPRPDPLTVYVADAYAAAARVMRDAYRERGYLSAEVTVPDVRIDLKDRTAQSVFLVKEGPQAIVRELGFLGLPEGFDPQPYSVLKVDEPFRFSGVEETLRELSRGLGRSGYLFARVDAESSITPDGKDALVSMRVEPGPRVRVGRIIVTGHEKTAESVVRANLVMRQGGVLDPESLFDSQRNLVRLGIFRSVAVRLHRPDAVEESKDVLVEVRERPRLAGELGGGYSLVDGVRAVGDFAYPNLGGLGTSLSGRLKVNYIGASALVASGLIDAPEGVLEGIDFRGNLALAQPRIWAWNPAKVGTRLDLVGERVHRPAFTFLRYAAVAGVDWAAADWLNLAVQYEIEHDQVRLSRTTQSLLGLRRSDLERVRIGPGNFSLWSVRPSFTLDFRDDFARPSKGFLFSGSSELTRDLGAQEFLEDGPREFTINTLKLAGNATAYVPLYPRVVLAVSARAGKIFHLEEGSRTIAPRRFYLGGAGSMRGFREDGLIAEDQRDVLRQDIGNCVGIILPDGCSREARHLLQGNELPSEGGELFTLGKAELRFPLFGALDMGLFLEAGNLWLRPEAFDPLKLRYVGGAGIRYGTPIGPVALDVGVNLLPDPFVNEQRANVHFSIGLF